MSQDKSQDGVFNPDEKWFCKCGATLGFVSEDKKILRIKYKDLYVLIEGGTVTRMCQKCGSVCRITSTEDEKGQEEV